MLKHQYFVFGSWNTWMDLTWSSQSRNAEPLRSEQTHKVLIPDAWNRNMRSGWFWSHNKHFLGFLKNETNSTWSPWSHEAELLRSEKTHKELRQFSYSQKFYERIIQIRWMRAKISTILDIFLQEMTLIRSAMVRHQNRTWLHLQVAFECRQPTWQPNEQNSIVSIICRGAYWGNHL